MSKDMEVKVTINQDQELFVIDHGDYVTSYGFDNAIDEIERISIELVGRNVLDADKLDDPHMPERGTMESWDHLQNVRNLLRDACSRQGERAVAGLTPDLTGLEGWRVEVVDREGDEPRRFIVGKSTGWMPCHLEISRRDSSGGDAARREYHSVRPIEQVR